MKQLGAIFILLFLLLSNILYSQPTQGLIGYWPFKGNAYDLSGFTNNGIVHNAVLSVDRFGTVNSAYSFNGINAYIDFGNRIPTTTNQLTISAWIKTSSLNSGLAYIVGQYGWNQNFQRGFHLLMYKFIQLGGRDQMDVYNYITSGNLYLDDNQWHNLVGVINNSIYSLWIDGIKINSMDNNHSNVDMSQLFNLYAGGHFNAGLDENKYFAGSIDDIRLYNRALSQSEILQLLTESSSIQTKYTVTVSSNPGNGGTTFGEGFYIPGQTANLTATPNQNFLFLNWTENNKVVSTNPIYQFNVDSSKTLVANFGKINCTITASTNPFVGGSVTGIGLYTTGQTATLTAKSFYGYQFLNWTELGSIISSNSVYRFDVNTDRQFTANFVAVPTNIENIKSGIPTRFNLFQNYPNPFNPSTKISFSLPLETNVVLKIYNSLGQEVAELINNRLRASTYAVNFNASNLKTGIYFCNMKTDSFSKTIKLVLMK